MAIRETWMNVCPSVGEPPILVLSYKNHAIDEFLVDLVTAEKNLQPSSLIRIGGSCNEQQLNPYLETNQRAYKYEINAHKEILGKLHNQRMEYNMLKSNTFISPLTSWESIQEDVAVNLEGDKIKRSTASNAGFHLYQLLIRSKIIEEYFEKTDDEIYADEAAEKRQSYRINHKYKSLTASVHDDNENKTTLHVDVIQRLWNRMFHQNEHSFLKEDCIKVLYMNIEHYKQILDVPLTIPEVIYRFVSGFCPKPKCSNGKCNKLVKDENVIFCISHLCPYEGCIHEHLPNHFLCVVHACQFAEGKDECYITKLPAPQRFCDIHACFVCVNSGVVAKLSQDSPPRNTCDEHRLCVALLDRGEMCSNLASDNISYCKDHENPRCIYMDSKNKKQCSSFAKSRDILYCNEHEKQGTTKLSVTNLAKTTKKSNKNCKGLTTKKQKPCKTKAMLGLDYCVDHIEKYGAKPLDQSNENVDSSWAEFSSDINNQAVVDMPTPPNSNEDASFVIENEFEKASASSDTTAATSADDKVKEEEEEEENVDDIFLDADEAPLPDEKEKTNLDDDNDAAGNDIDDDYIDDQLQHMRDVYVIEDREENDEEDEYDESSSTASVNNEDDAIVNIKVIPPSEWRWDMTKEERLQQAKLVEEKYENLLNKFQKKCEALMKIERKEFHNAKIRAQSQVYESKAVIGGTIVGCIGRLEAIRKVKPFAIVIEEASEVLEPLLFSCLGEDTKKFEMVGDHFQLKPQVMSKINFEKRNKINVSMFERLINAPDYCQVPSNALSIQRRMRKNICDLTRDFYTDIVKIEDHEVCAEKKIGDKLKRREYQTMTKLSKSVSNGREVPGVLPHIFFWTHKGVQTKADVGMSRVNKQEASMVYNLTEFLVNCGVPKSSIAILTPYKGQLMLMRREMMNKGLLAKFDQFSTNKNDSIRMSTVDRFQGDEADIVIISLVIDANSRTPFVKLCNRMIVLLSRARLGMYIIGNINYFVEKPDPSIKHWSDTITKLKEPSDPDTCPDAVPGEDVDSIHFKGARLGDSLPICCPIHRTNSKAAKLATELKLNFCHVKCTVKLDCSHPCELDCHFANISNHNKNCQHAVKPVPCPAHNLNLTCSDVYTNIKIRDPYHSKVNIEEALKKYRCPDLVDVQLPCQHIVQMECAKEDDITKGKANYQECQKLAHNPYVYPECLHELKVLCCVWFEYKKDPSRVPTCKKKVRYTAPCQHSVNVQCFLKKRYEKGEPFQCIKEVVEELPRCGHQAQVSCDKAKQLKMWKGKACATGIVFEGEAYGPTDHHCTETVTFERECGHKETMECHEAFHHSQISTPCKTAVQVVHPACGHSATLLCSKKQKLGSQGVVFKSRSPLTVIVEGKSPVDVKLYLLVKANCQEKVLFKRKCHHEEEMVCCDAFQGVAQNPCNRMCGVLNPLCHHKIQIPCQYTGFDGWKPWPSEHQMGVLHDNVLSDACPSPSMPPASYKKYVLGCQIEIHVEHNQCKHLYKSKCGDAMKELGSQMTKTKKCEDFLKDCELQCGHFKDFKCCDFTAYELHPENYKCKEVVFLTCWNNTKCKQTIETICNEANHTAKCDKTFTWVCPKKEQHIIKGLRCQTGIPLHCPDCVTDDIQSYMNGNKRMNLPPLPTELTQFYTDSLVTVKSYEKFHEAQQKILTDLEPWYQKQKGLKRPLFEPKLIYCFRYGTEEGQLKSTDFATYMKVNTLNGTLVFEWTTNNLEKLIKECHQNKKKDVCLLLGVLFCCRVIVDPKDMPSNNNKNKRKRGNWINEKKNRDSYFCVQKIDSGWDQLIVWDPYPIIASHKVWLSVKNLQEINSQMEGNKLLRNDLKAKMIECRIPVDAQSYFVEKGESEDEDEDENENLHDVEDGQGKSSSQWDGLTLGRNGVFDDNTEKELMKKLQFCARISGSNLSEDPYAGYRYLENQSKISNGLTDILLLKALEQQTLKHFDDAAKPLVEYEKDNKAKKKAPHPLYFVAKSRQLLSEDVKSDEGVELLKQFEKRWPDATEQWLNNHEVRLLKDASLDDHKDGKPDQNSPVYKWEALKQEEGVQSEKMDELMTLVGLRKVKEAALTIFKSALKFKQLPPDVQAKNPKTLNFCFLGNAGSGKTTVARLFADIFKDCGLRSKDTFEETTAQKLKDEGPEKFRSLCEASENGVLFIDEAYDLDPGGDFKGKPIVSELLTISENKRDKLSIILAGYEDDMNDKIFSFNEGIKSRFELIYFEDFNEKELKTIWETQIKGRGFSTEEKASIVVSKRLFKCAGRKGFGNARAVRKEVDHAINKRTNSDDFDPNEREIKVQDVMGPSPLKNPKLQDILNEIDEKIGWTSIKESVKQMLNICEKNYEKQLKGQKTMPFMLNRVFIGNPGTGKTTCAELYGRLLKELDILSIGEVVMAAASDLLGSHVGESQKKTNAMIEKARGKVLVIDEAYNLDDDLYGKQAIDTIVEKVQNTESDDIAVLLLGYEKEMREMMRNQNPGLARRFSMDYPFHFEDYSQQELLQILQLVCSKENIKLKSEVSQKIIDILEKQKTQANFGNAGAINNLIRAALAKASERPTLPSGQTELQISDLETDEDASGGVADTDPLALLDKLYSMEKIKDELQKIRNTFTVAKAEGASDMPELGHFVFRGAPGTGKTTVARAMATILFGLDLLPRNHVEETSGLDLTGEYLGQTKKKCEEKLNAAKGGILFIDEAYELGKSPYGEEAMTTILAAMTDPEYKLVIIIAGYPKDMEKMLARNVGLKSRFTRYFDFPDWNKEDCVHFIDKKALTDNYHIDEQAKEVIAEGSEKLQGYPGWGNARDVIAMWKIILEERANRVYNSPEQRKTISYDDVTKAVAKMVGDRKPKGNMGEIESELEKEVEAMSEMMKHAKVQDRPMEMLEQKKQVQEEEREEKVEKVEKVEEDEMEEENDGVDGDADDERDPGVPEHIWQELQQSKMKEAIQEEQRIKEERIHQKYKDWLKKTQEDLKKLEEKEKKLQENEKEAEEERQLVEELQRELKEKRTREEKIRLQKELEERRRKEEKLRLKLVEERRRQKAEEERLRKLEEKRLRLIKQKEEEAKRRAEEQQKLQAIQQKLKQISPCPAGFTWRQVGGGWRCAGGSHFVSDAQLERQFTH